MGLYLTASKLYSSENAVVRYGPRVSSAAISLWVTAISGTSQSTWPEGISPVENIESVNNKSVYIICGLFVSGVVALFVFELKSKVELLTQCFICPI